ncbi:Hypothetical protein PHPALM_18017 [Phytophthora palmivora]|uniref:Uncharacterized protein n=1 Tax=Phytophthora palmivora TaxID=4796 RepID=A0A2P4XKW1_9STRA|nr:Hypothetical protein PHPALM_18017 [Phytophthora palmivora]
MFGVASLLCRLGLRWRMNALQSSYSVSHFMATLSYLRPNGDGIKLVEYSSDPVLTLGATMIWYGCPMGLSEFILPEFTRLFVKEELDVATVNESAACIVLLLAMDTCVVIETNSSNHMSCSFMGQFLSVDLFLKVLGGHDPPLMTMFSTQIPEQNQRLYNALEIWRSRWADWKLGFCHFIQLTREPNEYTLWYLLGRRAAGIFAHEQNEVDLIIPIFRESEVSMILIQVEGTKDRGGDCPEEDIQLMDPFWEPVEVKEA